MSSPPVLSRTTVDDGVAMKHGWDETGVSLKAAAGENTRFMGRKGGGGNVKCSLLPKGVHIYQTEDVPLLPTGRLITYGDG